MLVSDFLNTVVECAAEDAREGDGVVDLVREVAATCGDDGGASFAGNVGHDFWDWVG